MEAVPTTMADTKRSREEKGEGKDEQRLAGEIEEELEREEAEETERELAGDE